MKLFVLFTLSSCVQAFSIWPVPTWSSHPRRGASPTTTTSLENASAAEDHLNKIKDDFQHMKEEVHAIQATHDEKAAAILAEKFLEKAIEFTKVQEEIEEAHVGAAHKEYEKVLRQEDALKSIFDEVAHDANDADQILEWQDKMEIGEDSERRREMAVSEVSHGVENYVESRFLRAKEEERRAKEHEDEAKRELDQLHLGEVGLRATLDALKERRKKTFED